MANRFVSNAISYHGKGAIQEIPGIVAAKGFQKAFIATDPDLLKFGVTKKVTDILDANNMAYEVYSDIKPNPTIENVQNGVAAYKASGADYMITVGGGSSMDTGKASVLSSTTPSLPTSGLWRVLLPPRTPLSTPSLCPPPPAPPLRLPSTTSSPTWSASASSSVWT